MLALLVGLAILSGCKDDDKSGPSPFNPNGEVNEWIYDNMDLYYLWTSQMPGNPDYTQEPEDFFDDLLSSEDRFSIIVPDYDELINSLGGISDEAGYEFVLFRESSANENVIALVLYIKKGTTGPVPAEEAGLMRGDVITQVNGTTMTLNNYQQLLGQMSSNHEVTYRRFSTESNSFEDQGTLSLSVRQVAENPNFISEVMEIDGQKVGYFMYTFFSPGPGSNAEYDNEMDQIFADFKSQGINQFILDLRYNSGGAVSSARNLASLIAPNVTSEDILYENVWNDELQAYIESLSNGDDILRGKFADKADNIGASLSSQTVYVLVGSRTASASELMINGLIPYMNVVIIGEETVGKNVGSIPIEDEENPENEYGILPIVFRTYNSAGDSEYANGFNPTPDNLVEEFGELPLEPLGTTDDPLVARALELMGISVPGRIGGRMAPASVQVPGEALEFSLDHKPYTNRMFLPEGSMPKLQE